MYTLDQLFGDIVKQRGGPRADKADYEKVWDAFNRYLTAVLEKRQTLNVQNFCKIGWRIEEFQGKARLRPHFQLAESFTRVFNVEAKSHPCVPDRLLTTVEEFNFSKAAIRYSQNLTKDNIFMGLRAIVHQIGEAASREQVAIDFEVGQLTCNNRIATFSFVAQLYIQEGLEIPNDAMEMTDYKPSVTFGAPSQDALTLNLQGTNNFSGKVKATPHGGWQDVEQLSPRSVETAETGTEFTGDLNSVCSEEMGRQLAHAEALTRHINQMEHDAAKVISEKHMFEGHLQRCNDIEQKDQEWRRAIAHDHSEHLKRQMRRDEERRAQDREGYLTHSDMHEFPSFKEAEDGDVRGYLHERRSNLKDDLDQQCESKLRIKQMAKQRDRELELNNMEAVRVEMAKLSQTQAARKEQERITMREAWDQDVKLKTVRKAIEEHHRTPAQKADLPGVMSGIGGSIGGGASPLASQTPRRLETPGALSDRSDRSSVASSRVSGSVRRMPIGAAASLALHREKLKTSSRR